MSRNQYLGPHFFEANELVEAFETHQRKETDGAVLFIVPYTPAGPVQPLPPKFIFILYRHSALRPLEFWTGKAWRSDPVWAFPPR